MTGMFQDLKEVLTEVITDSSKVFIVGHNEPDFDSIGSAIALSAICRILGRKSYIIVNESDMSLEPGVKKIIDEAKEKYSIIDLDTFKKMIDSNSSLIVTDTNKEKLVSVRDYLLNFKYRVIIDHHKEGNDTIDADYKYINLKVSSASEMIARILNSYRIKYDSAIASYLLAGIELDTKHFQDNTFPKTHGVAEDLLSRGANRSYISSLFSADFETDRRINDLVFNGRLLKVYKQSLLKGQNIAFALNRNEPHTIYKKEDLAKAADKLLDYDAAASFVIGYVNDDDISVSARSRSNIDVGSIMSQLGGGGNSSSGACRIANQTPAEVEEEIRKIVNISVEGKSDITTISVYPTTIESPFVKTKLFEKK